MFAKLAPIERDMRSVLIALSGAVLYLANKSLINVYPLV